MMVSKSKQKAAKQLGVPAKILVPVPNIIKVEDMEREIAEKDQALVEKDKEIAEKDQALTEMDQALAEKDKEIADLKNQLGKK